MDQISELSTLSGLTSEAFAEKLFKRYAQGLLQLAHERLGARLRAKVSPEDVVQSAFKSFFRRQSEFHFDNDEADGLWGLLVVITVRKCIKWADVFAAEKRAACREVSLHAEAESGHSWLAIAASDASPEEAAILAELVERLLESFDARQQQIVSLRMQGYDTNEIAREVQSSRRTVARVIALAKEKLRAML